MRLKNNEIHSKITVGAFLLYFHSGSILTNLQTRNSNFNRPQCQCDSFITQNKISFLTDEA